ncbi:FadR/GntR family transcriptional regulator [Pseudoduganella albidiflava]|uniref:FadR family transcriptional regulator n=2 Tax=Pseudoduganella albidiflava TaxID=321983 RepID=A0ABX5RX87_9BURK|nr:FadR/GntR family transcriptional regulator [Pseudoduganella albidiflava]QBI02667.1 FadR family transcriptional regulator [Pseudoduganella albidiflava]
MPPMDNHLPPRHAKPRNLAHAVISYVTDLIRDGRIVPGEKVPSEAEIIQALGVSRSVVREAMSQLQATGVVETRQGKGTFVLDRSVQPMGLQVPAEMRQHDVLAILELRLSLETESAGLAARRRSEQQLARIRAALDIFLAQCDEGRNNAANDTEFHLSIAQASGNTYLYDVLSHLSKELLPRARALLSDLPRDTPDVFIERVRREHEDIYGAIARQDAESARAAMHTHLNNSRERLRRALEAHAART